MIGSSSRLRIAILTHSTNARGGVVHGLELADALTRLGHTAVVHAPDPSGKGFFRKNRNARRLGSCIIHKRQRDVDGRDARGPTISIILKMRPIAGSISFMPRTEFQEMRSQR